jgi:hypothetical protein
MYGVERDKDPTSGHQTTDRESSKSKLPGDVVMGGTREAGTVGHRKEWSGVEWSGLD